MGRHPHHFLSIRHDIPASIVFRHSLLGAGLAIQPLYYLVATTHGSSYSIFPSFFWAR
jgi:hypothetical protein